MGNVQYATAIHILTILAIRNEMLSSAYIAGSINIDAAIVRRSLGVLSVKGLVETKEGKGGGAVLGRPASKILLSDIYKAVIDTPLLGRLNNPNPECNIGKQINGHLTKLYHHAEKALLSELGTMTLADFCNKFR
jgi:DNA-binding IscR family transcriptional regulator